MSQRGLTDDQLRQTLALVEQCGTVAEAAIESGLNRSTFESRYRRALDVFGKEIEERKKEEIELPVFPEDEIPVSDILDTMERRFEKRANAAAARRWFTIKVKKS